MSGMSRNNEKVESGAIYVIRSAEGPRYTGGARPSEADVRKDVGELLRAAGVRTVQPHGRRSRPSEPGSTARYAAP